jgi:hypothetical protein
MLQGGATASSFLPLASTLGDRARSQSEKQIPKRLEIDAELERSDQIARSSMSAFGGKADIGWKHFNVRF